jgi:hypothetical protein
MAAVSPESRVGSRLRFQSLDSETLPNSRFQVQVTLGQTGDRSFHGTAEGMNLAEGRMRAGAEATIQALCEFLKDRMEFEFRGARTVRTFDAYVVIVAVRSRQIGAEGTVPGDRGGKSKELDLIGCVAIPDRDLARGAALAVMNATNRLLEHPVLAEPGDPPSTASSLPK